jgi:Zn-dependent membrane protease YugP
MFGFFNPLFLILVGPALLLGLWAQSRVRSAFNKYSRERNLRGMTGAQVARQLLDSQGLYDVDIERSKGMLSDHYDPRSKVLRLSPDVHDGVSVAAAGIAAHEMGHALQDARGYAFLNARSAIVPAVQLGSWLGPIIFMAGFFLSSLVPSLSILAWVGVGLFGLTTVFTMITLPVEFDASKRAKQLLVSEGIMMSSEVKGVDKVLDAAALTYVAAAVSSVMTLLYYVLLLTGMRRD